MRYRPIKFKPEPQTPDKIRERISELEEFIKRGGNGPLAAAAKKYIEDLKNRLK